MNPKKLLALYTVVILAIPLANATSTCPANDPNLGPYNKVTILNDQGKESGFKLVDKKFTIKAVRVDNKVETPISGRTVNIYFYETATKKVLVKTGSTNTRGEFEYTPTKVGKYMVECAGKAPTFEVLKVYDQPSDFGAICGDGKCEKDKLEKIENCPIDCAECGDAICTEDVEDRDICPDDCVICGDGFCDDPEIGAMEVYCEEDCLKCGDGICRDDPYGEVCPADCEEGEKETPATPLSDYWWIAVVVALVVVAIVVEKRRSGEEKSSFPKRKSKEKSGWSDDRVYRPLRSAFKEERPKKAKEEGNRDEDDIKSIITELMDSGVSDTRIKGKLKEFGLHEEEAERLVEKAKRTR